MLFDYSDSDFKDMIIKENYKSIFKYIIFFKKMLSFDLANINLLSLHSQQKSNISKF